MCISYEIYKRKNQEDLNENVFTRRLSSVRPSLTSREAATRRSSRRTATPSSGRFADPWPPWIVLQQKTKLKELLATKGVSSRTLLNCSNRRFNWYCSFYVGSSKPYYFGMFCIISFKKFVKVHKQIVYYYTVLYPTCYYNSKIILFKWLTGCLELMLLERTVSSLTMWKTRWTSQRLEWRLT